MTAEELLRCINKLVPNAICAVCQDAPASAPYVKWDVANTTPMPTMEECEAVLDEVRTEIQADIVKKGALAKLEEIDIKSIRSLREWVSKQTDAPQFLKDYEEQTKAERAKLK